MHAGEPADGQFQSFDAAVCPARRTSRPTCSIRASTMANSCMGGNGVGSDVNGQPNNRVALTMQLLLRRFEDVASTRKPDRS